MTLPSFAKNRQTFVLWGRGGGGHAHLRRITFKFDAFTNVKALFSAVSTDFCKIILISDFKKKNVKGSMNSALACEQASRGALAAGREKEGELATTSLEFKFYLQFPCGLPSTKLSDFRQSVRSGNEHECKQTLKGTCQG